MENTSTIYVLIRHEYEDFELIGAFTDPQDFKQAYENLEKKLNDTDYRGDAKAFKVKDNKVYDHYPPEAWVYDDTICSHRERE